MAGISSDGFVQCHARTKPDHLWGTPPQNLALTPQPNSDPSFKMRDELWTTAHNTGPGRNKCTLSGHCLCFPETKCGQVKGDKQRKWGRGQGEREGSRNKLIEGTRKS